MNFICKNEKENACNNWDETRPCNIQRVCTSIVQLCEPTDEVERGIQKDWSVFQDTPT